MRSKGRGLRLLVCAALLCAAAVAVPQSQAASTLPFLTDFPEEDALGGGANQLRNLRAIGTDPATGAVYVGDAGNDRISQFDPWGIFVKAWGWGVEDGAEEPQTCGPTEPELSPPAELCQAGIGGEGPGQLDNPVAVAVDSTGNVYVFERDNRRVEKFSAAGEFLLMFGGEVNKTTSANVCTKSDIEGGDACGEGIEGTEAGFFTRPASVNAGFLALGDDGTVYVGDLDRIQLFEPDGTYKGELPTPVAGNVGDVAFDPSSGDLYVTPHEKTGATTKMVYRLDPSTGEVLDTLVVEAPYLMLIEALAVDETGNVYLAITPISLESEFRSRVVVFGSTGELEIGLDQFFAALPEGSEEADETLFFALALNSVGDLYVGRARIVLSESPGYSVGVYGPPPIELGPPPAVPPTIGAQFASAVSTEGATVKARINPRFWADTTYYVEYGTDDCEVSECQAKPGVPGATLTESVLNSELTSAGVFLSGLSPNTIYHYRFVAESSGGGPVVGEDRTFTTRALPPGQPDCANDAFRPGPAAVLPDCRAYEMVSPLDKNGADISVVFNSGGEPASLNQAAPDGEALTYSAYRSFGDAESAPYTSQYLATRTSGGWTSRGISPPRSGPSLYAFAGLDTQFKAFSEDLCLGWFLQDADNALAAGAVEDWPDLYRRDVCTPGYLHLAPEGTPSVAELNDFRPEVQGTSTDGSTAIFVAKGKLTANAATAKQLYEASDGEELRLVCILPNGSALKTACSAGTGQSPPADRGATLQHAISADGARIYWTAAENGPGTLYVRRDGETTTQVSTSAARFYAAAADGAAAIYSEGETLRRFELSSKSSETIAADLKGVLAVNEDASVVYFVSTVELAPGSASGELNLYRYEAGEPSEFTYLGELSAEDLSGRLSPVATTPINHAAQSTPDGGALAFMSHAQLTGYDNTDQASGQADAEVFLYRAATDTLICVSCNPTGARPMGYEVKAESNFWAAGEIPAAENQLSFPRVLSEAGTRLFFESTDPLALRDTNGQKDVYQWEAEGEGNCAEGSPGHDPSLQGCVNLISTGQSPEASELIGASADGTDVFFKTQSSLWPTDPGLVDVYDARAGGGFPLPVPPSPPCLGEACQNPAGAPQDPTPSSQTYSGPGNRRYCPKGKHRVKRKGKVRCVKKKNKQRRHRRHAQHRRHRGAAGR